MAAILDAILNFTPSARDPDCPPKFFYLPRGVLQRSRVKMRGHLIAHGIPLSPRTISFCNQLKAHYLATLCESRRYVVAFSRFIGGGIWLSQESLRYILASPGYTPGTIAINVT